MTAFAVGDRVSITPQYGEDAHSSNGKNTGTVVGIASPLGYNVTRDGCDFVWYYRDKALAHLPTFNKGDKVVATSDADALGIRKGVVYTVMGSINDGRVLNIESASGRRVWSRVSRFKQYEPRPQVFELRYGDKVRNTRTGREGQVWTGPISNILKVYDVRPPYRDGVPAAALEEYEDHHPGTYEIVSHREDSEEPY